MSYNNKKNALAFAQCIPNRFSFKLYKQELELFDELQKMTEDLDQEIAECQRVENEMKAMFDNVSKTRPSDLYNNNGQDNILKYEDMSKFLGANVPKLRMSDTPENKVDVDLDDIIATMKSHPEDLRKYFVTSQPQPMSNQREFKNLDLKQDATTYDQLAKRLANVKRNKKDGANNRNVDWEIKLMKLYQDINLFNQMVQAKTSMSESNKHWTNNQMDDALYDDIVDKLFILTGINKVTTCLLKDDN